MKLLLVSLLFSSVFANDSMKFIDMKIQNIDKKRSGINTKVLNQIQDPFYKTGHASPTKRSQVSNKSKRTASLQVKHQVKRSRAKRVEQKAPLNLTLIMNKSALVNKRWRRIGDDVEGYKIVAIKSDYIIVDQYGERTKLKIATANPRIRVKKRKRE